MEYLVTFYTHYGAIRFHKYCQKEGVTAKMAPVPRELSSSCGVCVRFSADYAPDAAEHEDLECRYICDSNGSYIPVDESGRAG